MSGNAQLQANPWNIHDTKWVLSLFGTAVGAGILFLPIDLGAGGIAVLLLLASIALPMTFYAHRGLARFILSSNKVDADFTDVAREHFGHQVGHLITLLYFLSIFPILLIYGVGLTNTVESFMIHQLAIPHPPRVLLAGVLVTGMVVVISAGEQIMLTAFTVMVYPLALILAGISIYLIPYWNMPIMQLPETGTFFYSIWVAIPVVIFSFSHTPAISSFVHVQRRTYGEQAQGKVEQILLRTSFMLIIFVLLFVFSCVLSLTPEQQQQAKAANISILSYLANIMESPFIAMLGPLVAFIAIVSSFLGHFLGARESLTGLLTHHSRLEHTQARHIGVLCMYLLIWWVAVLNPSILKIMEAISGPVIAMILFIMPVVAIYRVETLQRYRGHFNTYFIFIMGSVAISSLLYDLVALLFAS